MYLADVFVNATYVKEKTGMTILSAIGNTPLVKLTHLNGNPSVRIFAKLEGDPKIFLQFSSFQGTVKKG